MVHGPQGPWQGPSYGGPRTERDDFVSGFVYFGDYDFDGSMQQDMHMANLTVMAEAIKMPHGSRADPSPLN